MKKKTKWRIGLFLTPWLIFIIIAVIIVAAIDGEESEQNRRNTGVASLISPEVEAFRQKVSEECAKNGITGYEDLCLAVIMQESGGRVSDVMQSSESLGLKPNTLDTDSSIAQGVKMLAGYIRAAKVESPTDIDRIKIVLQAYNYGNGYLEWAIKRDGGWTQENALEFARIHSKGSRRRDTVAMSAGPWAYGDQYYVEHVLRYYNPIGNNNVIGDISTTNPNGEAILTEAFKHKGKPYVWGAVGPNTFDCSGFVDYVYRKVGIYSGGRGTTKTFIKTGIAISHGQAQPGDMVIFTKRGASQPHHMGIYLGNNKMIHAPRTGDVIKEASIYYSKAEQKIDFRRL